jgi:hypothetical protein
MFMLDLPQGIYSPPLDVYGSSCLWHSDIRNFIRTNGIDAYKVWTLQDVINIGQPPLINLQKIIYDILICNAGRQIEIDPEDFTASIVYGEGQRTIKVPIPRAPFRRATSEFAEMVDEFLDKSNLSFYRFYNLSRATN